jgi:hypothetical protein
LLTFLFCIILSLKKLNQQSLNCHREIEKEILVLQNFISSLQEGQTKAIE